MESDNNENIVSQLENLNIKKTKKILVKRKKVPQTNQIPSTFISPESRFSSHEPLPNFPIDSSLFQMVSKCFFRKNNFNF